MTEIIEAKKPKKTKVYFKAKELACKCGCGANEFDPDFLKTLIKIRKECGFSFPLSSAYRCPKHPVEARKDRLGSHTTGKAVDILCSGENALEVVSVALANGLTRIGVSQKRGTRFIHIDGCSEEDGFPPAIWSY
jgi:uncharacterized protein YcbK (DUF882 family)